MALKISYLRYIASIHTQLCLFHLAKGQAERQGPGPLMFLRHWSQTHKLFDCNFVHAIGITMRSNQTGFAHVWLPGDKIRQSTRKDLAT